MLNGICKDYCGLACVNGSCPIARQEEYAECGYDTIKECGDCPYYDGCKGCVLEGICHIRNKERNNNDRE